MATDRGFVGVHFTLGPAQLAGSQQELCRAECRYSWRWELAGRHGQTPTLPPAEAFDGKAKARFTVENVPAGASSDGAPRCADSAVLRLSLISSPPGSVMAAQKVRLSGFQPDKERRAFLHFRFPGGDCEATIRVKVKVVTQQQVMPNSISGWADAAPSPRTASHFSPAPSAISIFSESGLAALGAGGCAPVGRDLGDLEDPSFVFAAARSSGDEAGVLRGRYREMAAAKRLLDAELARLAAEEAQVTGSIVATQTMYTAFLETLRQNEERARVAAATLSRSSLDLFDSAVVKSPGRDAEGPDEKRGERRKEPECRRACNLSGCCVG
eukprot:TRINITY_DN37410_c0_g1_i1.p2 TRINITY_DN37410_c0_g1~~TRINITY_DN37410_c0_g1_i1.p2  ORF type:complete len:327 (+),score=102.84 TRINITY_DN37410_c0_g1_i1:73-1053(+)